MELFGHPFIVGTVFGGVPALLIAAVAWWSRRRRYRGLSSTKGFHMRYCSRNRFERWWKFFPWEGIGILKFEGQDLVFEGHPNHGELFRVEVPMNRIELHGRRNWIRNGLLPWLLLRSEPNDYYLCVETGPFIFGAGKKTRELLELIKQQAEQGGAGNLAKPGA